MVFQYLSKIPFIKKQMQLFAAPVVISLLF